MATTTEHHHPSAHILREFTALIGTRVRLTRLLEDRFDTLTFQYVERRSTVTGHVAYVESRGQTVEVTFEEGPRVYLHGADHPVGTSLYTVTAESG